MLLTFKIANGKTIQFEASDSIHNSFNYPTEYGNSDYYDISFFLTTHNDVIMTAGRTTNNKPFINEPGTYEVPFVLVINSQILQSICMTPVLGVKFRADTKGFIKNLTKLLDKKLESHFIIKPFSTELDTTHLNDIKPLLTLLTNIHVVDDIKEQLASAIQYIESLNIQQQVQT